MDSLTVSAILVFLAVIFYVLVDKMGSKKDQKRQKEEERSVLESRLHVLWGLSEIKKSLDKLHDDEVESWKGIDTDEEEILWVQVYCHREIRKIGQRLRELDTEASTT